MSNRKAYKNTSESNQSLMSSKLLILPIFLITIVLPLITKLHSYNTNLSKYEWYSLEDTFYDFYLYYKQWFFVVICGIMLIFLIIQHCVYKEKIRFKKTLLPLLLYSLLAFLSTIFSEHRKFGFRGGFEQFENVFCLIGYTLIVYYMYQIIKTEAEVEVIFNFIAIGALIIGIIGTLQTFGIDLVEGVLFSNSDVENYIDKVTMTLYNPNYAGVYTSMMLTIFITQLIGSTKRYQKILYSLVIITMGISLVGCQSKTGLIGVAASLLMILIYHRRKIIRVWYISIPIIVMIVLAIDLYNVSNDYKYINTIKNAFNIQKDKEPELSELYSSKDGITLRYKENTLHIARNEDGYLHFTDSKGVEIQAAVYQMINENTPVVQPQDERFYEILVADYSSTNNGLCIYANNKYWAFEKDENSGEYLFVNNYQRLSSIKKPETCFLENYASFGTYRGYIWSRTIPLLRDKILLGSGADSFIFEFPQNDYIGLYNNNFENVIISKPHNWYLQVGVQTGVVSMLCILAFFGIYIIQGIKIYSKGEQKDPLYIIGFSIFVGVICYLISGLANDSSIAIAPVFWVIVGMGYVINNKLREIGKS